MATWPAELKLTRLRLLLSVFCLLERVARAVGTEVLHHLPELRARDLAPPKVDLSREDSR